MPPEKIATRTGADSPLMVNSVQKAFRVLTVFSQSEPRLTLTQIVDRLGVDKSTAQRFTHTLQVMGFLDKDPVTKTLGVTVKVVDLAHTYLASNPLIAAAMPYMVHLSRETGETINLTVLDWPEIVFVSRIVGHHLLSTGVIIGTRLPAHATATGLAMLSAFDAAESGRMLRALGDGPSSQTVTFDVAAIEARLELARSKGYVLSVSDYFPTDVSLGAPVLSRTGAVLGGLSLSVSIDRFDAGNAEATFANLVLQAARSIRI